MDRFRRKIMSNNVTEQEVFLEEFMKNAVQETELDLDMPIDEEVEVELKVDPEKGKEIYEDKCDNKCKLPDIKINCDLEVEVGTKNKAIYVCPGKLQYFTAQAICCSGDETIEIEYRGHNTKCVYGEKIICGRLGYYKIVKSGIIFIPNKNLSEFNDDWFPTDVLPFKAKDKCDKDVEFVVVFTYSRCVNCECGCNKSCRF